VAAVGGPDRIVLRVEQAVVGEMTFLAAPDWRDEDVRADGEILLREGDPLAVGGNAYRTEAPKVGRGNQAGLAIRDAVAEKLLVRGCVEEQLRVRRPDERSFLVVEIGDLLRAF